MECLDVIHTFIEELYFNLTSVERPDTYSEELMWLKQRFNMNKEKYGTNFAEEQLMHDARSTWFFKNKHHASSILKPT